MSKSCSHRKHFSLIPPVKVLSSRILPSVVFFLLLSHILWNLYWAVYHIITENHLLRTFKNNKHSKCTELASLQSQPNFCLWCCELISTSGKWSFQHKDPLHRLSAQDFFFLLAGLCVKTLVFSLKLTSFKLVSNQNSKMTRASIIIMVVISFNEGNQPGRNKAHTGVYSWWVISWFYFPWNMNLGIYSSWSMTWSLRVTQEGLELLTDIHEFTSLFSREYG